MGCGFAECGNCCNDEGWAVGEMFLSGYFCA